jgi:hypothetical protein
MYQDTIDEHWVAQALAAFDLAKISYVDTICHDLPALAAPLTTGSH